MSQPIAGVTPPDQAEIPSMTVWPSIAAYRSGRFLGRLYDVRWPDVYIFRLGNLLAVLSIPHALFLYALRIAPVVGVRYTVTNKRIVVQRGWTSVEEKAIELDRFDAIEIEVLSGQEWFHAGNLIFRRGGTETFRLNGVVRPDAFRQVCLKARAAYAGIRSARTSAFPG